MKGFAALPVLLAATAMLAQSPAYAQRVSKIDGNKLTSLCTSADKKGCEGYLSGIADAMAEEADKAAACIPVGVTVGQMHDVVLAYIHANPATRELPAGHLVRLAYEKAWPCHH